MNVKLLTKHHLEFFSLKGAWSGSSKSALVKISHCWPSHVVTNIVTLVKVYLGFCCALVQNNLEQLI